MASLTTPLTKLISHPLPLFLSSALLRAVMLLYGLWQDANSPLKYTDIDYLVFTDAARFAFSPSTNNSISTSSIPSPYERETYRYTPLLSWLLYPTTLTSSANNNNNNSIINITAFSTGKILFAAADLLAGYYLLLILRRPNTTTNKAGGTSTSMSLPRACRFASIWLLNPMVATISTRGSSEGLLGALVAALLWAVLSRRVVLAGALLGLGVHFKIYPFVYAPAIIWWMDEGNMTMRATTGKGEKEKEKTSTLTRKLLAFITPSRIRLTLVSLSTFAALNAAMYLLYGFPFITHTYLHHVTRIDHRHNFSPYNVLLYLTSSSPSPSPLLSTPQPASPWDGNVISSIKIESVAFVPQLLLSTVLIPLVGAKRDLPTTMLAQTFAFVTFNKVCTSQVRFSFPLLNLHFHPIFRITSSPPRLVTVIWILLLTYSCSLYPAPLSEAVYILTNDSYLYSIFYGTWSSFHFTCHIHRY